MRQAFIKHFAVVFTILLLLQSTHGVIRIRDNDYLKPDNHEDKSLVRERRSDRTNDGEELHNENAEISEIRPREKRSILLIAF